MINGAIINVLDYGAVGDGTTDCTTAIQAAFTAAYNGGTQPVKTVYFPSGTYVVSSQLNCRCAIVGENGAFNSGAGAVIKWTGSGAICINFAAYDVGWEFTNLRFYTTVTTPLTYMYFAHGLNSANFSNIAFVGNSTTVHYGIQMIGDTGSGGKADIFGNTLTNVYFQNFYIGLKTTDPYAGAAGSNFMFNNGFSANIGYATYELTGFNNTILGGDYNGNAGATFVNMTGSESYGLVCIGIAYQGNATSGNDYVFTFQANTSSHRNMLVVIQPWIQSSGPQQFLVNDLGIGSYAIRYVQIAGSNGGTGQNYVVAETLNSLGYVYNFGSQYGMGEKVSPTFSSGNFTGSNSMTWTVSSTTTFLYSIVGKLMTLNFVISGTTVGGTPSTQLRITLPDGWTAAGTQQSIYYNTNNAATQTALMQVTNGSTFIELYKDLTGSNWVAGTTAVYGSFTFQVT